MGDECPGSTATHSSSATLDLAEPATWLRILCGLFVAPAVPTTFIIMMAVGNRPSDPMGWLAILVVFSIPFAIVMAFVQHASLVGSIARSMAIGLVYLSPLVFLTVVMPKYEAIPTLLIFAGGWGAVAGTIYWLALGRRNIA